MLLVLVLTSVLAPSSPLVTSTQRSAVTCQQGLAPSKVSYPDSPCEPCEEAGVAYPGNNLHAVPNYGVETVSECRQQCREEVQCRYWTWDKENFWCYLKSDKGQRAIRDERYVSGSDNELCDEEEVKENEIKDEENEREEKKGFGARLSSHTPIVSVYHKTGYRTVLTALPASFGLQIQNETEVTGLLNDTKNTFCVYKPSKAHLSQSPRIAVVQRGECKFSVKAENAAREGYQGIIILDTKEDTKVDRISGIKSLLTDSIPVVFLLHNEAMILQDLLREYPNRTATISDSSTFSWFKRPFTPSTTTTTTATITSKKSTTSSTTTETTTVSAKDKPIIFKSFLPFFGHKNSKVFQKSQDDSNQDAAVLMISEKTERRGIIEVTPLTIGAISVGVVVSILLIISVITLIVSRVRRKSRRRVQATRCQQAIRQFDAMNKNFGKDNTGYSSDANSSQSASRPFPKSTYNLLECPVCLEIAWPPKKIFQCREGHIVCDSCKANPQLKNCPMCRTPFSSHLISRNRSLEEVARALQEEGSVSSFPDSIVIATPTAPPPDVVPDYTEESESQDPVDAVNDTNQLIVEDTNPDALRILSIDSISAAPLVVNLPPDSN